MRLYKIFFCCYTLSFFSCVTLSKQAKDIPFSFTVSAIGCTKDEAPLTLDEGDFARSVSSAVIKLRNLAAEKKVGFLVIKKVDKIAFKNTYKYYANGLTYRCN